MKIEENELPAIFAAYFGGTANTSDGIGKVHGVNADCIYVKYAPLEYGDITMGSYDYADCKLILTRLSDISDDDAVQAGVIASVHMPLITRTDHAIILDGDNGKSGKYRKHRSLKIYFTFSNTKVIEDKFEVIEYCLPIADFLRSKSYNLGYGKYSPQDLIDAGVVE